MPDTSNDTLPCAKCGAPIPNDNLITRFETWLNNALIILHICKACAPDVHAVIQPQVNVQSVAPVQTNEGTAK